jgi:hypothetical protein
MGSLSVSRRGAIGKSGSESRSRRKFAVASSDVSLGKGVSSRAAALL